MDQAVTLPEPERFFAQVWALVRQVPAGKVTTYGQLAHMVPAPAGIGPEDYKVYGSRWVGEAMAACPADVPWQRVINSQGKISTRPGAEKQRPLLEGEGVLFRNDKIDLRAYQWRGPGDVAGPRQARLF